MVPTMFIQPRGKTLTEERFFLACHGKHKDKIADKDQLTSYVSTKAWKEFGNANAYDVNAVNSL